MSTDLTLYLPSKFAAIIKLFLFLFGGKVTKRLGIFGLHLDIYFRNFVTFIILLFH